VYSDVHSTRDNIVLKIFLATQPVLSDQPMIAWSYLPSAGGAGIMVRSTRGVRQAFPIRCNPS